MGLKVKRVHTVPPTPGKRWVPGAQLNIGPRQARQAERLLAEARALMYAGDRIGAEARMRDAERKAPGWAEIALMRGRAKALEDHLSPAAWYELVGWPPRERDGLGGMPRERFEQPLWTGDPIDGKILLIWAGDQKLGDTIDFSRLITGAKTQSQAKEVWFEVPAGLERLLMNIEGADVICEVDPGIDGFDVHCPIEFLLTTPCLTASALARSPFLTPEPEILCKWAALDTTSFTLVRSELDRVWEISA